MTCAFIVDFKGTVHPKVKMLSLFTFPSYGVPIVKSVTLTINQHPVKREAWIFCLTVHAVLNKDTQYHLIN